MESSMRLPAVDTSSVQSASQASRAGSSRTLQDSQASPAAAEAQPSVQVSISAEARAAEQAAAMQTASVAAQDAVAQPQTVSPTSTAQPVRELESSAATSVADAQPSPAQQSGMRVAEERGESTSGAQEPRSPDAASSANKPAVEMYLENASRPTSQAAPSTVRASA